MIDLSQAPWRKASLSAHNGGCVEVASLTGAQWRKASHSGSQGGNCVEVAGNLAGVVAIRDSKRPGDGAHVVTRPAFAAFIADAKGGRYDI